MKYRAPFLTATVFIFYLATLAPTVLWGDDAFLQRTAVTGELPPDGGGHWLWLQIARLFVLLPWGDAAFRVNLLSAVTASLTVGMVYTLGIELALAPLAAAAAALSLAVSHTFWTHAVRAEVYTLFLFCLVMQLWLWFHWRPERCWPTLIAALLLGPCLLVHQMGLLLLPALAYLLWRRRTWLSKRAYLSVGLGLSTGLFFFLGIIWLQTGRISLLTGLPRYFTRSRADFGPSLFDFSPATLPRDLILWLGLSGMQFVGLGAILGAFGLLVILRRTRTRVLDERWAMLLILYATGVLFALSYHVNDQYVFFLPSYLAFALFAGYGCDTLARQYLSSPNGPAKRPQNRIRHKLGSLFLLTLLAVAPPITYRVLADRLAASGLNPLGTRTLTGREPNHFFLWPDKGGYEGAAEYADEVFSTLPQGAVLIADHTPLEPLLYRQLVENIRSDVRLVKIEPGQDLAPVLAMIPTNLNVYLADNNPDYYDLTSVPDAKLEQSGAIYRLYR